jgi:Protein of unknown function (DUF3810)
MDGGDGGRESGGRTHGDRPLRMRRRLTFAAIGSVPFLATLILARIGVRPLGGAGDVVGPWISWLLSRVTGVFPFSLVEWLFVAWLGWRVAAIARGVRGVAAKRWTFPRAAAAFALVLVQDAGVGVGIFYAAWGFNYARPAIEARQAWSDEAIPDELVVRLAGAEVDAANAAYRELHGSDDAGEPTAPGDLRELHAALEEGWRAALAELGWTGPVRWPRGPVKRLLISPLMHRAGLSGFYAPYTGEANVNRSVPAVSMAHVVSHEMAHQRAVGPEDEANFLGYLAAAHAPSAWARYSAHVFAQRQLLRSLLRTDRERATALIERRLPGVQRDVNDLVAYWELSRGTTGRITHAMNDTYLKANRVEGGVASYGGSLELLLRYARARDEDGGGTGSAP